MNSFRVFISRLRNHWQDAIHGFWFIPLLVFLLGPALAALLLLLDWLLPNPALLANLLNSPSTVRGILSTITGSLITVAGLVFSLTMVALQQVSNQFGPRVLRGFLGDRILQVVAGAFIGISAYCLIVLTAVRDTVDEYGRYIPILSTTLAYIFVILSLALLLFFIGRTVQSLQIANITARIVAQTIHSLKHVYPTKKRSNGPSADPYELVIQWRKEKRPRLLNARRPGYIQTIAFPALLQLVESNQLRLHLTVYPGIFVTYETVIAEVWSTQAISPTLLKNLQQCFSIANERDMMQDPDFGIRQLADMALRAISAAINDPTSALLCMNRLQTLLEIIAQHPAPTTLLATRRGMIIARHRAFKEYCSVLIEICHYAAADLRVVSGLLHILRNVARTALAAQRDEYVPLLVDITNIVKSFALQKMQTAFEVESLTEEVERTLQTMQERE